jgi:DNA-binding transcriptional LysR family regulator
MTLDQLNIFAAVADRLSMTRAAESLNLTQSAVSAAIAALEGRHRVRLFDRIGRGIALSTTGEAFLPEARAVLARAEAATRALDDLAGLRRGSLRIAASQTVATYWLPQHLARFAAAHPGIALALVAGNSTGAAAAVQAGEADFAIVEGPAGDPAMVRGVVGGDRLALYAAPGHRLVGRPVVAADLSAAAWVMREPGSGTRDHLAVALAALGIDPAALDLRLELPSNGAVLAAVEAGGLIAAVSDLAAGPRVAAGRIVRLDLDMPARDFRLLAHPDRRASHAARAFLSESGIDFAADKLSER